MPLSKEEQHFRSVAPDFMRLLLKDFPQLNELDAAAVFGNAGHESKGLTDDQEDKPVVKGSRGGANWMQWTGPRRRELEAYCKRNGLDPNSDEAAYKWLFLELKGSERATIPALVKATSLKAKVIAFEKAFLRAGVKHYDSRLHWAEIALDALQESTSPVPDLPAAPRPAQPPAEDYETDIAPGPSKRSAPSWLALAIIITLAVMVGVSVFFGGQAVTGGEVSLLGDAPIPHDRPFGLFGGDGSRNLWADIGVQIALSFVAPLVSAAATALVGWIGWQWQRVLKADFDAKSADALHKALERGMLAAIDALGARAASSAAGKTKLLDLTADYAASTNPDAVKHFKLAHEDLAQLAVPHLVGARRR